MNEFGKFAELAINIILFFFGAHWAFWVMLKKMVRREMKEPKKECGSDEKEKQRSNQSAYDVSSTSDDGAIARLYPYSNFHVYDVGSCCSYRGLCYKCIYPISMPEEWNPNHWVQIQGSVETTIPSDNTFGFKSVFYPFPSREMIVRQLYEHIENKEIFTDDLMDMLMDMDTMIITNKDLLSLQDHIIIKNKGRSFELTEDGLVDLDANRFVKEGLATIGEIKEIIS